MSSTEIARELLPGCKIIDNCDIARWIKMTRCVLKSAKIVTSVLVAEVYDVASD